MTILVDFWEPESLWEGKTVFVIGGGPSLKGFDFEKLDGKNVLVINEAYREVPWADVLFFRDFEWFERAWKEKFGFPRLIVTISSKAQEEYPELIKLVRVNTPQMPRSRTSGHNAVSLALTMCAKRIVLLGFDWNREGGNYHERHVTKGLQYRGGLLDSWVKYKQRAEVCKCEIINCTPGSQIKDFKMGELKDFL